MIKRIKRVRSDRKAKSKSKSMTPAPARRFRLFGQPQILEGEDAAAYDELLARICDAIKPVDTIEEMFIADVVSLEWEVLRWRRLKLSLIRTRGLKAALRAFLNEKLDYDLYSGDFAERLTEILQDNLPEDRSKDFAQTLAHACARHESEAVDKVPTFTRSTWLVWGMCWTGRNGRTPWQTLYAPDQGDLSSSTSTTRS